MTENENDDERLLNLLEPQAADDLPPGFIWGKLSDCGIGAPVAEFKAEKRGNRIVTVPTRESRKLALAAAAIKWPVLDPRAPEAVEIWQAHSLAVHAEQERQRGEMVPSGNTAKRADARPTIVRGA